MYSGKSTELCRRVRRLQTIKQPYIIYNSVIDTRYGVSGIYTHNNTNIPSHMVDNLMDQLVTEQFKVSMTIFIDEAQFFEGLYEFVKEAVEVHHKQVIVIGLDGDSDRNNFGEIHTLFPIADDITKLKALCSQCNNGTPGIFSKKIINSSETIDVGSNGKYIALCRPCYLK